jgi:hypothetical protein
MSDYDARPRLREAPEAELIDDGMRDDLRALGYIE